MPACEGTVRDAAADEKNGDFAAMGFAKEVGPNFGFEDDDDGRLHGLEDTADGEGPVERKEDDSIREGHALFGEGVAS